MQPDWFFLVAKSGISNSATLSSFLVCAFLGEKTLIIDFLVIGLTEILEHTEENKLLKGQ